MLWHEGNVGEFMLWHEGNLGEFMLGTVEKVGQTLDLFTRENPEWGVSEVARALDIPKSSAHELLSSLTHIGVLHRLETGRYKLGFKLLALSQILLGNTPWRDVARREILSLVERLGETVQLAAMDGGQLIYVDRVEGTKTVQLKLAPIGASLPAHCSALGKIMLASKPWDFVLKSIKRYRMKAFTSNTITALDELATELERVRKNGYAFEIEEMVSELCAVATPIHNHNGEIIASLSISVPSYRFASQKATLQQEALQSAQRISQMIGYDPVLMKGKGGFKWHSVRGKEVLRAH